MKRSLRGIASAVGLLCLAGVPAWAGPISTPVAWTYNFTPTGPTTSGFVNSSTGSGTVSFTNEPTKNATNSSDVVVTNLRDSSTASPGTPDTLNNSNWQVSLKLTDSASNQSATMLFSGQLNGTFSQTNSNISNKFTGTQSYTYTLGNNQYTVTLTGYTPPGPPTASNAGSISAHVSVTPLGTGGQSGTPEPSTLVLSCLGLGFAGLASWRKRRRSLAAMLA